MTRTQRTQVFISYSRKDAECLGRLRVHLDGLDVDYWVDTRIDPGKDWRAEIDAALARAKVAVLLLSGDFLRSEFIRTVELPAILAAQASDGLVTLPVHVRPCRLKAFPELERLQAVNAPAEPMIDMNEADQDRLGMRLADEIDKVLGLGPSGAGRTPRADRPPHNLPFDSLGSLFKGRDEALAELHEAPAGDDGDAATAIVQKQAISGLGGIGKTRLAIEYAWRYARAYTALLLSGPMRRRRCGPAWRRSPPRTPSTSTNRRLGRRTRRWRPCSVGWRTTTTGSSSWTTWTRTRPRTPSCRSCRGLAGAGC